ncbi:hypothetical protein EDM80_07640 [bacterium]|nr:MAG: hypothetical protein EDM80_07640 [bacterium]RIK64094.1 MAG: hypothetical protein DCC64_05120 [Planctomycetota bacterium]
MLTLRNLLTVFSIASAFIVVSACSVMPFQPKEGAERDTGKESVNHSRAEGREEAAAAEPEGKREVKGSASDAVADSAKGQAKPDDRKVFDHERRREVELRWLKDRAAVARQEGRLEDAEEYLVRAMELNPGNPDAEVKGMLEEVRMMLSKSSGGAPAFDAIPKSAQQEYEIEASRTYDRAKAAERGANWGDAAAEWEKLLRLLKFMPYSAEMQQKYEGVARAGLRQARVEQQKERKRLEDEAIETERRMAALDAQSQEDRKKEEILELYRQVIYLLELRRFKSAEEIIDRILYLDPQFRKAEELKRDLADQRLIQLNRDSFNNRIVGYYTALREMREAMVPQTRIVTYPTGLLAERIRQRKGTENVSLDPKIQQTENILASKIIPMNYEEETFENVVVDIRKKANINIVMDKDVKSGKGQEQVTIALDNIPVGSALKIILTDLQLTTTYKDGVLFIVGEGDTIDASQLVTRVHDVRDLTFNISEFVGPSIRLKAQDDQGGGPSITYPDESEKTLDIERIEELVTEAVAKGQWDAPFSIKFFGGQLVATHTPAVQAELRDFLNELRKIAGLMVHMEVRFISVEDDYLTDFGIDFRGNGGPAQVPNQAATDLEDVRTGVEDNAGGQFDNNAGGIAPANPSSGIFFNNQDPNNPPVNFNQDIRGRFEHIYDNALGNQLSPAGGFAMQFAYFFNLTQINAVISAVQKRRKARLLTAPRLSAFNTQRANITIVNQIPYIRDFEIGTSTSAAIANPVVDTILDGMVLDVKPTVSNDRRFITIEVQPTIADLLLPIPTFTTTLGPTSAVTIQIPEIKVQTVQTTVRVPDGGAVVIAGLKTVRDVWRESGVPLLSDIPLLGVLFRRQGRSKEQFNLVIVIHARVVDLNDEELRQPWATGGK